jgi:hypothetical protein
MHYNFYLNYLVHIPKKQHQKLVQMHQGNTSYKENFNEFKNFYHRCIINSINDPNVFIMDHLLLLEPVKVLEGENIHNVKLIYKILYFNFEFLVIKYFCFWSFTRLFRILFKRKIIY